MRGPIAASFKLFDENKDGQLSREELEHMLTRTVPPPSQSDPIALRSAFNLAPYSLLACTTDLRVAVAEGKEEGDGPPGRVQDQDRHHPR